MSHNMQYTGVNRIISKIYRDTNNADIDETNLIEWIGEALEFIKAPAMFEHHVAFLKVTGFETDIPKGFQMVTQLAKFNGKPDAKPYEMPCSIQEDLERNKCSAGNITVSAPVSKAKENCGPCANGKIDVDERTHFYFDMPWLYPDLKNSAQYRENFTPIRLANHTFFNTLVCKERDQSPYSLQPDTIPFHANHSIDEYTIAGVMEKKLRFSFKEGHVALSYVKNAIDEETGYPLVPDNIYCITAIGYYVKWKIAEMYAWNAREGYDRLAQEYQALWLRYIKQAKNDLKMPSSIDQLQNMLEQTHHLFPQQNLYYGFFGNLGRREDRRFNDPGQQRINHYINGRA